MTISIDSMAVLNPYWHTGFLLKDFPSAGQDTLVDMAHVGDLSFAAALEAHGSSLDRVKHVFITHFHGDHFLSEAALDLAERGATIYMDQPNWDNLFKDPLTIPFGKVHRRIEELGQLEIIPSSGQMMLGDTEIRWIDTFHCNTPNLSFAIDNLFISGDMPYQDLFVPTLVRNVAFFNAFPDQGLIATFSMTRLTAARMELEMDNPVRIANIKIHTSLLENLLKAMPLPEFQKFFRAIDTIIPNHFRRRPFEETARLVEELLDQAKAENDLAFHVRYR